MPPAAKRRSRTVLIRGKIDLKNPSRRCCLDFKKLGRRVNYASARTLRGYRYKERREQRRIEGEPRSHWKNKQLVCRCNVTMAPTGQSTLIGGEMQLFTPKTREDFRRRNRAPPEELVSRQSSFPVALDANDHQFALFSARKYFSGIV